MRQTIAIDWKAAPATGHVEIERGTLVSGQVVCGGGRFDEGAFSFTAAGPGRLELAVEADHLGLGAEPTLIRIRGISHPFTFFPGTSGRSFQSIIPELRGGGHHGRRPTDV